MKTILTDTLVEQNASRDALIEHARHMEEQRRQLAEYLLKRLGQVNDGSDEGAEIARIVRCAS